MFCHSVLNDTSQDLLPCHRIWVQYWDGWLRRVLCLFYQQNSVTVKMKKLRITRILNTMNLGRIRCLKHDPVVHFDYRFKHCGCFSEIPANPKSFWNLLGKDMVGGALLDLLRAELSGLWSPGLTILSRHLWVKHVLNMFHVFLTNSRILICLHKCLHQCLLLSTVLPLFQMFWHVLDDSRSAV